MSTRSSRIITWICISVLTIQFLAAGVGKLVGSWTSKFAGWGYPPALMYAIGTLEIIDVIGLFFSKTRKWSAMILILIMIGAACTHLVNSEPARIIHNAIVAGLALLVLRRGQRPDLN